MSTNEESPPRDLELPKTISSHLEDTGSGVETATVLPDKTMKDAPDRPNEPPRLSDRSMGVHSPFKAHEVLTSPPDAENNALPPSSPFQSFIEANEPNEDDTLPLQETTEESPVTIKAEVGNDQPDKAPEKRGRASKTPQPDTLPLPHVAPMSEPKPPRVDKDKAEKKRTRASESDVVLPRRQAASSASFSPLNEKVLNENAKNSSRLSKTPEPDAVIRHHSIPMSEPKPVRTSKAANMAGGMTDLISASSLHEIGAKETSPAVPSQTPQSDTAPHRQPVPASEPKPARISKAKVKPTRVSESDVPGLTLVPESKPTPVSNKSSRASESGALRQPDAPSSSVSSLQDSDSDETSTKSSNAVKTSSTDTIQRRDRVPKSQSVAKIASSLQTSPPSETSIKSSRSSSALSSDTMIRHTTALKSMPKPRPATKANDADNSSKAPESDISYCFECESEDSFQHRKGGGR